MGLQRATADTSPPTPASKATPRLTRSEGECGKFLVPTARPAIFDCNVLAFDKSGLAEALAKCVEEVCGILR
jgi:hypothetical protein